MVVAPVRKAVVSGPSAVVEPKGMIAGCPWYCPVARPAAATPVPAFAIQIPDCALALVTPPASESGTVPEWISKSVMPAFLYLVGNSGDCDLSFRAGPGFRAAWLLDSDSK